MPSQFDDADEEQVARAPVARPILRQEASKYGSATGASLPSVATKQGGRFPAYGQDRYTPVLPTEKVDPQFGGLDDVLQLSGSDPRFQDDTDEDEAAGEEEYYSDEDGAAGDLMWFDGHEGVSGNFAQYIYMYIYIIYIYIYCVSLLSNLYSTKFMWFHGHIRRFHQDIQGGGCRKQA